MAFLIPTSRSWLAFASRSVMPKTISTFVMKKKTTSSRGRISKKSMPVVWVAEIDHVVSVRATMSIRDRYTPGTKIPQNTSFR
jgi:hypothetical protein